MSQWPGGSCLLHVVIALLEIDSYASMFVDQTMEGYPVELKFEDRLDILWHIVV
jgi:hypothetical protein